MAAATILRIQDYTFGSVIETTVYYPNENILTIKTDTGSLGHWLQIGIRDNREIELAFLSSELRAQFISDLEEAMFNGHDTVVLSNRGPVATTTTTTTQSTTTTTSTTEAPV